MSAAIGQLDFEHLFRSSDGTTSIEAAVKASKASRKAVEAVRQLFAQAPLGRTDQEIRQACRNRGFPGSLSLFQHARKALVDAGVLVDTGEVRDTEDGCSSRVWGLR